MQSNNSFPPHSRVWIYQSNRILNEYEQLSLQKELDTFTKNWQAHQLQLIAGAEIFYKQFVVFFVDEAQVAASGCSIDKSVNLMQHMAQTMNVDFFDRTLIAYKNANQEISSFRLSEFNKLIASGMLTADTIIFNNLVSTKAEFQADWQVSIKHSWLAGRLNTINQPSTSS